jgi:glycerophosphoryl diester phosphodiesterase
MIFFSGIVEGRIKLHRDINASSKSVKYSTAKLLFDVSLLTFVSTPSNVSFTLSAFNMKAADTNLSALNLIASNRPLVIGHRGYCQFAPENTLPSFKFAMAAGADLVELDYHHTKDGKLIVIHDSELDRTTDATSRWNQKRIKVASRTAAEIQSLDAGSWFDAKYAGTKIPLLAEAIDTIQQGSITLIERKDGDPGACIKLLHNKSLINKVVVQAFDWEYLRQFHQQEPEQILAALGPPTFLADGKKPSGRSKELSAAWLDDLLKTGAKIAVWNQKVSKEAVQLAHELGLKAWVYTINDPALANRLLDKGVDGLITNNTSLIWRTMALRASSPL